MTVGRQSILSLAIIGLAVPCGLVAAAALAQVQLLAAATSGGGLVAVSFLLFFAIPLAVASGFPMALALRRSGVRLAAAYGANAIVSAALAAYTFIYNFSVAENMGELLWHLPRNGRDASDGMITAAPPFRDTLADTFGSIGHLIGHEGNSFIGTSVLALVISLSCGWLFWRRAQRVA